MGRRTSTPDKIRRSRGDQSVILGLDMPRNVPPVIVKASRELSSAYGTVGDNKVYKIEEVDDIRLALYRMAKCRDHNTYSALNSIISAKGYKLIVALTRTVVQRALNGIHELVSMMLTDDLLSEMEGLVGSRRLVEGVYVVSREVYERVLGLAVNQTQACAALVSIRAASVIWGPSLIGGSPMWDGNAYIWEETCRLGRDERSKAKGLEPPIIILDDVRYSDNIGLIMRTAYSLGVKSLLCTKTSWSALGCRAARTSMGAFAFLSLSFVESLTDGIAELRANNVRVLGTSPRGTKVIGPQPDRQWALVLGNEDLGSSEATMMACDELLFIPQVSGDSLSVSVAAGICIFELMRDELGGTKAPNIEDV